MLTRRQQETFQKLKEGKLTTKQKADFYYRVSNILKDDLESIDDLMRLIDELPDAYLEKIDFRKAAVSAMKLTETLIKKLDPVPLSVSDDLTYQAVSYLTVHNVRHGKPDTTINVKTTYAPTEDEIEFFKMLKAHADGLKALTETGMRRSPFVYGAPHINEEFISRVLCEGKPCRVEIVPTPEPIKNSAVLYPLLGNYWGAEPIHALEEEPK